jgi:diguanylate cyclase
MKSAPEPEVGRAHLARQLGRVWDEAPPQVTAVVVDLVARHSAAIASAFYQALLLEEDARRFLAHDLVRTRLHGSMTRWLVDAYTRRGEDEWLGFVEQQAGVGLVHARIGLPVRFLALGARILRHEIFARVLARGLDRDATAAALLFAGDVLDLACEAMNEPYLADVLSNVRQRQSLQVALAGHTLAIECERLKGSLFDWHRAVIGALYEGGGEPGSVRGSAFALWSRHKAALSIGDLPEYRALLDAVERLEAIHDRQFAGARQVPREGLRELGDRVNEVAFVLSSIADRAMATEAGRDALTRLLNRRFLDAILRQEISLSLRTGVPFSILVVDIDDFKAINDRFGHPIGDRVLVLLAETLLNNVRVSDFVFRYGGEEFLVVLSEIDSPGAVAKAEHLRQSIEGLEIRTDSGPPLRASVSIGVAAHDGHPDLQRVVRAADRALYEAKANGKNRVVVQREPVGG